MKKILILLGCFGPGVFAHAQSVGPSVINAAGGSGMIVGKVYEWSVGELVTDTYTGGTLIVTQGVLQPLPATTGVKNVAQAIQGLNVYPNPVTEGTLYLNPDFSKSGKLTCQVLDVAGKAVLVQSMQLTTGKELQSIDMRNFANGQYTLSVLWDDGLEPQSSAYKIQKMQ